MPKSYQTFFILTGFLFLLGSCSKELSYENPNLNQTGGSGNFYATIDGQPWMADSLQLAIVASSGVVTITGISKTGDEISMVLPGFQTGVYATNGQSVGFALFTNLQDTANLYLTNTSTDASKAGGTVSLTTIDTVNMTLSGTFQFKLYQQTNTTTKTVTQGVFSNIPYSGVPASTGGGNADTLMATVDSIAWNPSQITVVAQTGVLVIMGISADGQQSMALSMPESVTTGTYTLDVNSGIYMAYYINGLSTYVSQGNGNLTVISNDSVNKRINGRFGFVGASQTDSTSDKITNGYFSVKY